MTVRELVTRLDSLVTDPDNEEVYLIMENYDDPDNPFEAPLNRIQFSVKGVKLWGPDPVYTKGGK